MTTKNIRQTYRKTAFSLIGILLAIVSLTSCDHSQTAAKAPETVYERVMRTKTLRVAWLTYPPAAMKETTTGKMSGTFVDALNQMGSNLGLKIEWMDGETPWGQQIEGLNEGRYDIVGSPVWANPARGQLAT